MTESENRILIVDDEESMRRFLSILLEKEGYQVSLASSGEEALQIRLVNRLTENDELESFTREYVKAIVENAPLSVKATKGIVNEVLKTPADWDMDMCGALVDACSNSEDFKEGRAAFREKRQPRFTGK